MKFIQNGLSSGQLIFVNNQVRKACGLSFCSFCEECKQRISTLFQSAFGL